MSQEAAPSFAIEKLYVKDMSLEVPNAPEIFLESESPEIGLQLQTAVTALGEDAFEVTLTTTVTAKLGEEKTVFLVEVAQAGIFRVRNVPEDNLPPLLSIACPNILFPYAREVVSDVVSRAGFAPVVWWHFRPRRFTASARMPARRRAAVTSRT